MSLFFAPSRKLAARRLARGGPRIYDPRERLALGAFDWALRAASPLLGLRPPTISPKVSEAKRILALRLDRLGDLVTTLPALRALRRAAPDGEIELGVGSWNEPIATRLPFVDRVRIVDTPWASWDEKASLADAHRALQGEAIDLAIDFQGDIRVLLLMARAGATLRAGYGETGGAYLLTHRGPWDESKSWYRQNMDLVATLFPDLEDARTPVVRPYNFLTPADREAARKLLPSKRPLVGIHPSAGRRIKQWEDAKFAALVDDLSDRAATVVLTGAESDRALVERIARRATSDPKILLGADVATFAAVIEGLDVFVTGDTGPMHLSHAVGTRNVAIFGPSDPVRYGPDESLGLRTVVREPVYCSPCNMIRRPPAECARLEAPDCISGISGRRVRDAILESLRG